MRVGPSVLREATAGCEYARLFNSAVFTGRGVPRGDGGPVVLVPGFLCADRMLGVMHGWLRRIGYETHAARLGVNLGCGERDAEQLEQRVAAIAAASGTRVSLIGYSRGAHPARVLASRRPDLACGVVTLGAPSLDPRSVHLVAAVPAIGLTLAGTAGAPRLMKASCFRGACCADFRADLVRPLRGDVRHVAVRSRRDGIVDHRYTPDTGARHVEIRSSHAGYLANPQAFAAVADALESFDRTPTTTTSRSR